MDDTHIPIALMNLPVDYDHEYVDFRIVGGEAVSSIRLFPWMTSLKNAVGKHFCGAMLIHPSWLLTAKHCGKVTSTPDLLIGGLDLNNPSEFIQRKTKRIVEHPDENVDVLLIELDKPVNDRVPIKLNKNPNIPVGIKSEAIGWGRLSEGGQVTNLLQEVILPIVDNKKCEVLYPNKFNGDRHLCAGVDEGAKDACQGDSGGPLIVMWDETDPSSQYLIGVTSWGIGCARKGKYGVWVKTSYILPWVVQNIPGLIGHDVMLGANKSKARLVSTQSNPKNQMRNVDNFPSFKMIEPYDDEDMERCDNANGITMIKKAYQQFQDYEIDKKSMTILIYSLIILSILLILLVLKKLEYL